MIRTTPNEYPHLENEMHKDLLRSYVEVQPQQKRVLNPNNVEDNDGGASETRSETKLLHMDDVDTRSVSEDYLLIKATEEKEVSIEANHAIEPTENGALNVSSDIPLPEDILLGFGSAFDGAAVGPNPHDNMVDDITTLPNRRAVHLAAGRNGGMFRILSEPWSPPGVEYASHPFIFDLHSHDDGERDKEDVDANGKA